MIKDKMSDKHKEKIGNSNRGKYRCPELRKRISDSLKRYFNVPENRKRISDSLKRYFNVPENRLKLSKQSKRLYMEGKICPPSQKGKIPPNKGKTLFEQFGKERAEKIREQIKVARSKQTFSEVTREKLRQHMIGSKNHAWKGGTSFEPYSPEFNDQLKEQIRKRDSYRCQECMRHQNELFRNTRNVDIRPYKLIAHHIDHNKKNNIPNNLISLCLECHGKTEFNQDDWERHLQNRLHEAGAWSGGE